MGKNIIVIGGGTVGFEKALMIADGYPDKKVTIVESGEVLATNRNELYKSALYQHLKSQEN